MKYFYDDRLAAMTSQLSSSSSSMRCRGGRLEAFTMKRAGGDKKYAADLGSKYTEWQASLDDQWAEDRKRRRRRRSQSEGGEPPPKVARLRSSSFDLAPHRQPTALGDFADLAVRRLMTDLILTLNMSFPDYDFGEIRPHDFQDITVSAMMEAVGAQLADGGQALLGDLWSALDAVIHLSDCVVYQWTSPPDDLVIGDDDDDDGDDDEAVDKEPPVLLWSFYYLIVNKTLKRIVFFTCWETMQATPELSPEMDAEEEEEVLTTMRSTDVDDEDYDDEPSKLPDDEDEAGDFDLDPTATAGGIPVSTV